MKLYHGTLASFDKIQLVNSYGTKDFGIGFYTTDKLQHAKGRAEKLLVSSPYKNNYTGTKYIYSYNIDKKEMKVLLNTKEFTTPTIEWLDMVVAYRAGFNYVSNADIIIGPTADSQTMRIINNECMPWFDNGNGFMLSNERKERIIKLLKTERYGIQYCFKTQRAIDWLQGFMIERRIIK